MKRLALSWFYFCALAPMVALAQTGAPAAIARAEQAVADFRARGDPVRLARSLNHLADLQSTAGLHEAARDTGAQALRLAQETAGFNPDELAVLWTVQGERLAAANRDRDAFELTAALLAWLDLKATSLAPPVADEARGRALRARIGASLNLGESTAALSAAQSLVTLRQAQAPNGSLDMVTALMLRAEARRLKLDASAARPLPRQDTIGLPSVRADIAGALEDLQASADMAIRLGPQGATHAVLALGRQASMWANLGRETEALAAIEKGRGMVAAMPPAARRDSRVGMTALAQAARQLGRLEDARSILVEAAAVAEGSDEQALVLLDQASEAASSGRMLEVEPLVRQALRLAAPLAPRDPTAHALVQAQAAELLRSRSGRAAQDGLELATQARAVLSQTLGPDDVRLASLNMTIAGYLSHFGRHDAAARAAVVATQAMMKSAAQDDPGIALALSRAAFYLLAANQEDGALELQELALRRARLGSGANSLTSAVIQKTLGDMRARTGDHEGAARDYAGVEAVFVSAGINWHPTRARNALDLGQTLLLRLGRPGLAWSVLAPSAAALQEAPLGRDRANDPAVAAEYARFTKLYALQMRAGWLAAHGCEAEGQSTSVCARP